MAMDMFLKIEGVTGESQDDKHKDEIQILNCSWGATNASSAAHGSGSGSGKVHIQDFHFDKYIDKATASLFLHCCEGKHFPTAQIVFRKAGGEPLEYLTIKLKEVYITSMQFAGHNDQDKPVESLSFSFAEYAQEYKVQDATGKGQSAGNMGWNVKHNKKV